MTRQWVDPDEWRKEQYRPDEMAQRIYRSTWRTHVEMQLARLNALFVQGDELAFAASAQSFAEYCARMDVQLRESLNGGPLPETEDVRAAPIRQVRRVS
ncbi:hypothetical protein [Nocardia sp. CA-290969]|uniref:hypothetical protein n=1 Tax=Nocardia sp. CA-290969 TaxID=3239986 RepID=UPI003D8C46EF